MQRLLVTVRGPIVDSEGDSHIACVGYLALALGTHYLLKIKKVVLNVMLNLTQV